MLIHENSKSAKTPEIDQIRSLLGSGFSSGVRIGTRSVHLLEGSDYSMVEHCYSRSSDNANLGLRETTEKGIAHWSRQNLA